MPGSGSAFDDPKVPGVACHISQARTGGIKGGLGLAEDPSRFSIACPDRADHDRYLEAARRGVGVFRTDVHLLQAHPRVPDRRQEAYTFVHVALSDKIIEGSPQNSLSTV